VPSQLDLAGWTYLAREAKAGRMTLDPAVAGECAAACDALIDGLRRLRTQVASWDLDIGLGDFHTGDALGALLREIAVGDGGLDQRLAEHIDVVSLIRDTIVGHVARIGAVEDHTAAQVANAAKRHTVQK
jgi:hypothetical protein